MYDALNVLMAMDIISKDKKEIQWKGLPRTSLNDIEELKVWIPARDKFWSEYVKQASQVEFFLIYADRASSPEK